MNDETTLLLRIERRQRATLLAARARAAEAYAGDPADKPYPSAALCAAASLPAGSTWDDMLDRVEELLAAKHARAATAAAEPTDEQRRANLRWARARAAADAARTPVDRCTDPAIGALAAKGWAALTAAEKHRVCAHDMALAEHLRAHPGAPPPAARDGERWEHFTARQLHALRETDPARFDRLHADLAARRRA